MDKIKVPSGTSQKIETIIDNVQSFQATNITRRLATMLQTYGAVNDITHINNTSLTNYLKIIIDNESLNSCFLSAGTGIFPNGELVILANQASFILNNVVVGNLVSNTTYLIKLKHAYTATAPLTTMTSFVYNRAEPTSYNQRFSKYLDSYTIVGEVIEPDGNFEDLLATDEIALAILKTNTPATSLNIGLWIHGTLTAVNGVIDLRPYMAAKISKNVLNDYDILFKDRDSTGSNQIRGDVEADKFIAKEITITSSGIDLIRLETDGVIRGKELVSKKVSITTTSGITLLALEALDSTFNISAGDDLTIKPVGVNDPIIIKDKDASTILYVDTVNKRIGIKKIPTTDELEVNGKVKAEELVSKKVSITTTSGITLLALEALDSTFNISAGDDLTIKPVGVNDPIIIKDKDASTILYVDTVNKRIGIKKIPTAYALEIDGSVDVTGTIKSEGKYVATNEAVPGTPSNFRIFDVYPTNNKDEKMGYVHVRWNWSGITGTLQSNNQVVMNTVSIHAETIIPSGINVAQKQFRFSSSTNVYNITSYTQATNTITLSTNYDPINDVLTQDYPGAIIDKDAQGYRLRSDASKWSTDAEIEYGNLSEWFYLNDISYVYSPSYILKLELGKRYTFEVSSFNRDNIGTRVVMGPGSYDPDHAAGGQTNIDYTKPYVHALPNLYAETTPALTATPTSNGFIANIAGWGSLSSQNRAHEFQFGYTTLSGLSWTYNNANEAYVTGPNRILEKSCNQRATWLIGARPIQNKTIVGNAVYTTVAAGSTGGPPAEQVVVSAEVKIIVLSGIVQSYTPATKDLKVTVSDSRILGSNTLNDAIIIINADESTPIPINDNISTLTFV